MDRDQPPQRLCLKLPAADASGVARAREAVTRHAELLGLDEDMQERIRLAVTEACTNCVLHAYGAVHQSSYHVGIGTDGRDLVVVVQDWGTGIAGDGDTSRAAATPGLGFGLRLMQMLATSVDIASRPDRGTRVELRFALAAATSPKH